MTVYDLLLGLGIACTGYGVLSLFEKFWMLAVVFIVIGLACFLTIVLAGEWT